MLQRALIVFLLLCLTAPQLAQPAGKPARPNVILILVDDQGYGDIAALGNPVLKTPHMDKLHSESVRLTDYHVDPTCSPTRAALLTGRYSTRAGVWHTINGRSLMHGDEYTLAEYFRDNGYRTAMFGKWHLGSNAPLRPMDQGFDHCVWSPGGAVNQGANYLGNDTFDDTYKVNDQWQKFDGYHTDIWFDQAMRYIGDTDAHSDKPFFVYLPTTAVHDPWNVTDDYAKPYLDAGIPPTMAKFYGMITNVDDNLGRLRAFLAEKGLAENTILIYTTDNGTTAGWIDRDSGFEYFNAGMRGWKGSEYEGGHRVPFFLHWPGGEIAHGEDISMLAAHIDVMPTLAELCGLPEVGQDKQPRGKVDGVSLARKLREPTLPHRGLFLSYRALFVHVQRERTPPKWVRSSVMTEKYRLVNGEALYDIIQDPGQHTNIAAAHPSIIKSLREKYDEWWASLEPVFDEVVRFDLGGAENPTTLMSHDWLMPEGETSAWHHNHVRSNALVNGPFMVNIVKPGKYRITPMRWPEYVDEPLGFNKSEVEVACFGGMTAGGLADGILSDKPPYFDMDLTAGPATLTTMLTREDGKTFGAYYVKIELIKPAE